MKCWKDSAILYWVNRANKAYRANRADKANSDQRLCVLIGGRYRIG